MAGHFWVTGTAIEAALVTTLFELCCSILSGIIIQITTVVCSTNIYSLSSFCYTEKPCFEIGKEERKTPGCASSPEEGDKEEFKKSLRVRVNLTGWVATWWTNTRAHMALRGALEKEKSRPIRIHAALDHSASAKGKSPEQVGGRWGGGVWEKGNGRGRKKQMNRLRSQVMPAHSCNTNTRQSCTLEAEHWDWGHFLWPFVFQAFPDNTSSKLKRKENNWRGFWGGMNSNWSL